MLGMSAMEIRIVLRIRRHRRNFLTQARSIREHAHMSHTGTSETKHRALQQAVSGRFSTSERSLAGMRLENNLRTADNEILCRSARRGNITTE